LILPLRRFGEKLLQKLKLEHFLPIFTFMFYAYSEYLYLNIIFLDSLLGGKPFLRSKASPQPRSPPPNIVSVAGPFVNFDSGFCDWGWFELSSHQEFTFNRMTLYHAPNLLTPTPTPINPSPNLGANDYCTTSNTLHAYCTLLYIYKYT